MWASWSSVKTNTKFGRADTEMGEMMAPIAANTAVFAPSLILREMLREMAINRVAMGAYVMNAQ
jgi:hypothetical protein